jgi:hypothetical protein
MIQGTIDRGEGRADISVPAGCPSCGGALDLRLTPSSAFSYCAQCHRISRSVVAVGPNSVEVGHPPAGIA